MAAQGVRSRARILLARIVAVVGGLSVGAFQLLALVAGPPDWSLDRSEASVGGRISTPAALPDGGREFTVASIDSLQRLYERADFHLDPVRGGKADVPRLYLAALPGDFDTLEQVDPRKRLFLRAVLPLVLRVNAEIAIVRTRVQHLIARLADDAPLVHRDQQWLTKVARRYGVIDTAGQSLEEALDAEAQARLLRRVDGVPIALALAQAIVESGWGQSRFAREGNALYGQWTWDKSQGIAPTGAPDGEHAVKAFDSLSHSVRGYMHNLNTHPSYAAFRTARATGAGARDLARTLTAYSERGADYGEDLVAIIEHNDLFAFEASRLGVTRIRRGGEWKRFEKSATDPGAS